jgi:hypothetical protein
VASDDYVQVSTVLLKLRNAAQALAAITNPIAMAGTIASIVSDLTSILREVPGDPDGIDTYAAACRTIAADLDSADIDLDAVRGSVPAVWEGESATRAAAALTATQQMMELAAPSMRSAAGLMEDYAEQVRGLSRELAVHKQALSEVVSDVDSALDVGRSLLATVVPLWDEDGLDDLLGKAASAVAGAISVFEQLEQAEDTLRRGMRDIIGKARAGAVDSPHLSPFDTVLLAVAGISGTADEDNGILTTAQLRRAGDLMDALSPQEREELQALLQGAGSDSEPAYILKALAAGHSIAEITAFAGQIRGKSDAWLREHLSLVDPGGRGEVRFGGYSVEQFNSTTCGSTSILVARAMNDPLYAMTLTTDGNGNGLSGAEFYDRLAAEEQRIHDSTNTLWPQSLGTSPWGLSGELNEHADSFGAQYDWRLVDDTDRGSVNPALDDAVGAVDAGYTVPVLIGDSYPAHYVLLVGHEGSNLVFYDPAGRLVVVSEDDFRNGNLGALGYQHVQGVIVPR